MLRMDFIEAFLSQVEGPCQTRGYIPCHLRKGGTVNYRGQLAPATVKAMGASGVTIATGCDLGQTDSATLKGYGVVPASIVAFAPYLGKKKDAAIAALHAAPLSISQEAARALDLCVHQGYLKRYVRPAYERASGLKFNDQPKEAQAVIMSVCFQKGCSGVAKDWPRLWSHLCKAQWLQAAQELLHGFSQYKQRRQMEGRLLLGAVSSNATQST